MPRQLRRRDLRDAATYWWAERALTQRLTRPDLVTAILTSCRDHVPTAPGIYYTHEPISSPGIALVMEYVPRMCSDPPMLVGIICIEEEGVWLEGYQIITQAWQRVEAARMSWTAAWPSVRLISFDPRSIASDIYDALDEAIAARAYQALAGEGSEAA